MVMVFDNKMFFNWLARANC